MNLSLVERETILLYNQAEPMAEVYTHDPRLMEKLEQLAKKHPGRLLSADLRLLGHSCAPRTR